MPFLIMFIVVAIVWPYLMGSLFEWNMHPGDWGWYTRMVIALVYAAFGYWILRGLDIAKRKYYGTLGKGGDDWRR